MTYHQARIRITVYFLLAWALRVATVVILFTTAAKGFVALNGAQGCGPAQHLCDSLQNGIADVVNSPFFPTRIWLWLPDVPPQVWYLALLSPVGLCAAFFLLFTFFLDHERRNLSAALKEALAKARVNRFNQQTSSQSVGSMKAGRDIKIEKIEQTLIIILKSKTGIVASSKAQLGKSSLLRLAAFCQSYWVSGSVVKHVCNLI